MKARILSFAVLALTAAIALAETPSMARRHIEDVVNNSKIIYIDGRPDSATEASVRDSLRREIVAFYYHQFRHFDDPVAPFFQFMSREANLTMGLGGAVRLRGYYDMNVAVDSPAFSPFLIPVPRGNHDRHQLGTTPAGTCLYFQVLGSNKKYGDFQLYIEANFNGYAHRGLQLKKAFATFHDITIGLETSTFADLAAQTPMVDANGPANKIAPANMLIRYMPKLGKRWLAAVSLEDPDMPATYTEDTTSCVKRRKWTPDMCGFLQYQWGVDRHVRLSAMYRYMPYRDLLQQTDRSANGWALQLSSVLRPLPQLTAYLSGVYGRGYTSVLNDLMMGNYCMLPDRDTPGKMYAPYAYGWNIGVQYHFRPNLFSCIGMGQVRYLPQGSVSAGEYRYGQLLMANLFWNPSPRSMFGIEYDFGVRRNQSGARGTASRIGAVAQFSF